MLIDAGHPWLADANRPGAVGAAALPTNTRAGLRVSTALAYLPPYRADSNLTVRGGAEVGVVTLARDRVTGVRLTGGEQIRAPQVIVCAGAYASPVLLLRSGIGPADELRGFGIAVQADLPGVGASLTDHPAVSIDLEYPAEVRPGPLFQVLATARTTAVSPAAAPDLQYIVGGPFDGEPGTFFVGTALLKPDSRGSVRLRSADPAAPPRIELGYFRARHDLDRLVEGLTRIRAATGSGAIKKLSGGTELAPGPAVPGHDRAGLRDWVRRAAWTYHHPVGTCAMGGDPAAGAVVNATGAVYGICGLFVADASVMPEIPSANTHLPAVMIAERIAAFQHP